jgi:muramoyltetrapeptide carboxypeptidase
MIRPILPNQATIGLVALSSHQPDDRIRTGIATLERLGYNVVTTPSCFAPEGPLRLSGTDADKLADLHTLFERDDIDGIVCVAGGYGTPRLVDAIDYDLLRRHPKVFCGFSDVTLLLNTIAQRSGFVTYHGPMVVGDFTRGAEIPHVRSFLDATSARPYVIQSDWEVLRPGRAEGRLFGGNLSMLAVLAACEPKLDLRGAILLIEDVHEANYRIDRMLQTLRLAGWFDGLQGVIIGGITGESTPQEGSRDLFEAFFADAPYPVLFDVPIGHVIPRHTVPIGGVVRFDTTISKIDIL